MIVRDKPAPWELLFILKGSIVPKIWPQLLLVLVLSAAAGMLEAWGWVAPHPIMPLPFSLIGIALSIFAAFRNSASYERWWEARKLLGQLVIEARSLARLALTYLDAKTAARIVGNSIAFSHALRCHLRDIAMDDDVRKHLKGSSSANVLAAQNVPNQIAMVMGEDISQAVAKSKLPPQIAQVMEERLLGFSAVQAGAERIKSTPLPFAYSLLLHRTAYVFCFLLPFGLADSVGYWTPLLAVIVAYTFFGLDALGDELAAPFALEDNGLPLNAITRTIEINLLEQAGAKDIPDQLRPQNYVLN